MVSSLNLPASESVTNITLNLNVFLSCTDGKTEKWNYFYEVKPLHRIHASITPLFLDEINSLNQISAERNMNLKPTR